MSLSALELLGGAPLLTHHLGVTFRRTPIKRKKVEYLDYFYFFQHPYFLRHFAGTLLLKMSSFFTLPASQKRKRNDRATGPASKKRGVDSGASSGTKTKDRDQSISGSDLEDDDAIESGESGESEEGSDSESDEGETAADRRLKLAERYLENVRDEVDDVGFDAAEIDRDLIAERLKEDVVCLYRLRVFMRKLQWAPSVANSRLG